MAAEFAGNVKLLEHAGRLIFFHQSGRIYLYAATLTNDTAVKIGNLFDNALISSFDYVVRGVVIMRPLPQM